MFNPSKVFARLANHAFPAQVAHPGLTSDWSEAYASCMEGLLLDLDLGTVVDCPCGEFGFARLQHFPLVRYMGLDSDARVIADNAARHPALNLKFACANILTMDLPGADLLLCRGLFNHLPTGDILGMLRHLPRFRWALFSYRKGPNDERDAAFQGEGECFGLLDLARPPFALPGTEVLVLPGGRVSLLVPGGAQGAGTAFARLFGDTAALEQGPSAVPCPIPSLPSRKEAMASICLNMIVKNEAKVIRRCLDSVLPFISNWVIMDTGSTDGTQALIQAHLADVPGELFERPWTNFGQARTEALARVGGRAEYILVMDADDQLVAEPGFTLPPLTEDAYFLDFRLGNHAYRRIALVASRLPWRYEGVLHEYLTVGGPFSAGTLEGVTVRASNEGSRSDDPDKYRKDAQLLEQALVEDPGNSRSVFYLAQSYRDAGMAEESLAAYLRRAELGGFEEEVWYSLFESARLMDHLGRPEAEVVEAYLRAYEYRPARAEALCSLARYLRLKGRNRAACLFAEKAAALPQPPDILFVDTAVYRWLAMDEFSVAAYWTGRVVESQRVCAHLLAGGILPEGERDRVQANLQFALTALAS